MQWIEGITRLNGQLTASSVNIEGQKDQVSLAAMKVPGKALASHRYKLTTDFSAWTQTSVTGYLSAFGFRPDVAVNHRIFAFTDKKHRFLVPSLVLMKALFRPLNKLTDYLFSPQGLANISVLETDGNTPKVAGFSSFKTDTKFGNTLQPLSWYWSFPSAHNCWHSVYLQAVKGNLALDLPIGSATLVVQGKRQGRDFFVTELTLLEVVTTEKPFDYAVNHPQVILFHEKVGKPTFEATGDNELLPRDTAWAVSDDEWNALKPIVSQSMAMHRQKHDLRDIVDWVLTKLGTGTPWRNVNEKKLHWNVAQHHYRKWSLDGRWDRMREILIEMRATV